MNYRLDKYLLNELDGKVRLLFESEFSYLYVWIFENTVAAFQYVTHGVTALNYFVSGEVSTGIISNSPFTSAITEDKSYELFIQNLEQILDISNEDLSDLVIGIKNMLTKKTKNYALTKKEIDYLKQLPQSKKLRKRK